MKGFGGPMPLLLMIFSIFAFFHDTRKRRRKPVSAHTSSKPDIWKEEKRREKQKNVEAVNRMVAAHTDCTAEVFNVFVSGRENVERFRKVHPGDPVEIRRHKGQFKVFVENRYVCELSADERSLLTRIFDENIPFEAFLGGRDMQNAYRNAECDFCSIIIFYRIPGIAPTKVNLE